MYGRISQKELYRVVLAIFNFLYLRSKRFEVANHYNCLLHADKKNIIIKLKL